MYQIGTLRTCYRCGREFRQTLKTVRYACPKCVTPKKLQKKKQKLESGPHLTPREKQVVDHLSKGEANKEIAAQLHLTEGSIKGYICTIMKKLGLPNRTAVAMAAAAGKL